MRSRKVNITIVAIIILGVYGSLAFFVFGSLGCALSEEETQQIAGQFLLQVEITPAGSLKVNRWGPKTLWRSESEIKLENEDDRGHKLYIMLDCENRQVWMFSNRQHERRLLKQYNLKPILTDQPFPWPRVISEAEALEKGKHYARAIPLPPLMELKKVVYSAREGVWQLLWERRYGEHYFPTDDQFVYMELIGVDGQLRFYKADYWAPVEDSIQEVTQKEALESGWQLMVKQWGIKPEWRSIYELRAEILYVRPWRSAYVIWPRKKSARLAWFVLAQKKKEVQEPGVWMEMFVYIDAEDGKYLGGDRTRN